MSCGLRDIAKSSSWHLDTVPQICLFAAGLSNVPSPHTSGSVEYLHKGSTGLGGKLCFASLLLF